MESEKKKGFPIYVKFGIGALAGCGVTLFCQPIDVIKTRMQMSGAGGAKKEYKNSGEAFMQIIKKDGPAALYDGFTASLARQVFYQGTKIGVFQIASEELEKRGHKGVWSQTAAGFAAGFFASVVACPADVAMVRMMSDKRLPEAQRRKYKNVFDAIIQMVREEGILTLWAGVVPTVTRAVAGSISQLVTYKQSKDYILQNGWLEDGIGCHLVASMISRLVYAFSTTPIDVAKTRIQNMKKIDGKPEFKGMSDVWINIIRNEGIPSLWKGLVPYYLRIAPYTVLLFVFTEQLTSLYKKYVLKDTSAKGGI